MRILCGIPVLFNGDTCLKAFKSIINEADLLIVDNGSEIDVKQAIKQIWYEYPNVKVIHNQENVYVNKAWSQIIEYFLNSQYDQLVIMNSDLIMSPGWSKYLEDGISCLPCDGELKTDRIVFNGTMGIAIHLNKEMAKLVYPIPESIKIWFGDDWCFGKIRKAGFKTIIKANYIAQHWHNGSQTCQKLKNFQEIIAQDKLAWLEIEKTL